MGTGPDEALTKWLEGKDCYLAGQPPPLHPNGCSVLDAVNRFLTSKEVLLDTGELSPGSVAVRRHVVALNPITCCQWISFEIQSRSEGPVPKEPVGIHYAFARTGLGNSALFEVHAASVVKDREQKLLPAETDRLGNRSRILKDPAP